ncbi:MAG: AAA family ATPase [Bacteroides sp.]|nr:AAA family ATPase [Bacteroides sp.]
MKFFDREKEVALLQEINQKSLTNAQFTVLTGRRRIGKTTLVFKAYQNQPIIYLFVSRKSEKDLCSGFMREIESKVGIPMLGNANTFGEVFEYLMKLSRERPLTVFIDEFQDFKFVNPSVFSDIQRIWDLNKEHGKINLIVGGSINSLMNEIFRDNKQPLYQRETRFIKLHGFSPSVLKDILSYYHPNYTHEDLLALYSFTGGVAKYVELFIDNQIFTCQQMVDFMVRDGSTFLDEGKVMLIGEFGKEYGTYFSILSAIAGGHTTRNEIEDKVGKEIGGYLSKLENDYELISKRQPIYEKTTNKNVTYSLKDNFLTFWFRFIFKFGYMLEIGSYRKLREVIMRDYETFSGCMLERYFRDKLAEGEEFTRIGGWWDRKGGNEIDIVTAEDFERKLDFIEVKRQPERFKPSLLEEKIKFFFQAHKELASFIYTSRCLSMEDM